MLVPVLVDLRQQLSADVFAACGLAAHQTLRGRNDIDAVTTEHFRNLARSDVNAPARRRDALEVRNRRGTACVVAEKNSNRTLETFALDDEVVDVALFLQDAGNLKFERGSRNINSRMLRRNGVADSRQHIGNGISHEITPLVVLVTSSTSRRQGSVPAAPARENRCGTG